MQMMVPTEPSDRRKADWLNTRGGPRRAARRSTLLAAVVMTTTLAACTAPAAPTRVARPAGDGLIRYRDPVFPATLVTDDIVYGSSPGRDGTNQDLLLDLYEPAGDTAATRPAVVWVHGGAFQTGDKNSIVATTIGPYLAKRGYVVVSINYRLLAPGFCVAIAGVTDACHEAALAGIHDAQAAVRWLRAHASDYGIDPERIGIGGESAGAIIATGVGARADEPGDSGNPGWSSSVRGFVSISGGLPDGSDIGPGDAPGLLFSGTKDVIVPYAWSVATDAAMRRAHVDSTFESLTGAAHVPWAQYSDQFLTDTGYFFYRSLDAANAAR